MRTFEPKSLFKRDQPEGYRDRDQPSLVRASLLFAATAFSCLPADGVRAQALAPQTLGLPTGHNAPLVLAQASDDQREFIMEIQRHLQTLGLYDMAIDGIAGPGTWGAVDQFMSIAKTDAADFGAYEFEALLRATQLYEIGGIDATSAIRVAADPDFAEAGNAMQRGMDAFRSGQLDLAEENWRWVMETIVRLLEPSHPYAMITRSNLADAMARQGRHAEVETLYRETLAIESRTLGPDHPDTFYTRNELALVIAAQGRYTEAEDLHREDHRLREVTWGPDHPNTLVGKNNLAQTLYAQGRYHEAEVLHRENLVISKRVLGAEHPETLTTRNNLANALGAQGRHAEAEELHRENYEISQQVLGADHLDTVTSRMNLAASIQEQRRYAEAEILVRRSLEDFERLLGIDHPLTLISRNNLATLLSEQGNHVGAEDLHRVNLASRDRILGPDHPDTLISARHLAQNVFVQGDYRRAEPMLRDILDSMENSIGPANPQTLGGREDLSVVLHAQEHFDESLRVIEEGFAYLPQAFAVTAETVFDFGRYFGLAWASSQLPESDLAARTFPAQGYLTYGDLDVALGDMAARQQVGDAATVSALREIQDAREDLQRLRRAYLVSFEADSGISEEARERLQSNMRAADERFSEIAARIDREFPALAELELPRALSADEAQALLEPGEGLLAYASLDDHLYAWLVTPEGIEWHRMDAPRAELAERVAHLRASLDLNPDAPALPPAPGCGLISDALPDRPFDLCAARELHEIVLGEIDLSGIEELIVVPDGPLESLPFAMLVSDHAPGDTPRWLIEEHAIATLPTTSSLRALRQGGDAEGDDDRLPFLGIAPVEFDATSPDSALRGTPLAALPGTADEVRLLSGLLGAGRDGTVIGSDATEAFVKSAPLERYRVLSFATHGLLSREAEEVTEGAIREMALALRPGEGEDGFLTASEVAGLRLDADWVLLSACNTAGGDGDDAQGLSGLARAFFFAGARALMVSHWLIDDAVTPQLMADTMERSGTGDGLSRAQALRQAQLAMLSQRDHTHPFYWAPFSVVGENR